MFRFPPASDDGLDVLLDQARKEAPTYGALGATQGVDLPPGYRHDRHDRRIGSALAFERAKEGLRQWQAHVGAGAKVFHGSQFAVDETVPVQLGLGSVQVIAPCRIVYVIDEPDRFGLAYGTLPGHPESGEEAFVVEKDGDSTLFRITAFSRPGHLVTRLGGPVTRRVQVRMTHRYLDALERYVAERAGG